MKTSLRGFVVYLSWLLLSAGFAQAQETDTEDFIRQAHQYDNMYALGPQTSQQAALRLYEQALTTEPDDQQRLHILYRMAQLNGSAYQLEKGEKPDFHRAIETPAWQVAQALKAGLGMGR